MTRAVFTAAGVALALSGCIRTVEERELIVERIIDPAPAARALPRCAQLPAPADTRQWRRDPGSPIALPPDFALDDERRDRDAPLHGATYWQDAAGRTVRLINGHWDVSEHPDACHAVVNDALVVIVVGHDSTGHWVDAWPVSRSGLPTPRYDAVGFDAADQQLFLRILQTYRAPEDE